LPPPSATREAQPYISRTRIAQPIFRLTNGRLTTGGDDHEQYPARFGPTILSFPPVLQPVYFGGPSSAAEEFSAGYACDAEGNQYLKLTTTQRKFHDLLIYFMVHSYRWLVSLVLTRSPS
jgi:hypothetical protein